MITQGVIAQNQSLAEENLTPNSVQNEPEAEAGLWNVLASLINTGGGQCS